MHALMQSTSNPMVIDTNKVVYNNIILTFADQFPMYLYSHLLIIRFTQIVCLHTHDK